MSSRPCSRQWRRNSSTSNGNDKPNSSASRHDSKSTREFVTRMLGAALEQIVHRGIGKPDRQHAVLEAVVVKNIGEAGGDDHAETVIAQRPRGMLAAGAAAEIPPRQQNAGPAIFRPVQFELGIVGAIVVESPIEKQKLPKAGALDPLEKLLGDDLIGIDIRPIHRSDEAGVFGEGGHKLLRDAPFK